MCPTRDPIVLEYSSGLFVGVPVTARLGTVVGQAGTCLHWWYFWWHVHHGSGNVNTAFA